VPLTYINFLSQPELTNMQVSILKEHKRMEEQEEENVTGEVERGEIKEGDALKKRRKE
jgi:hypothetical protein